MTMRSLVVALSLLAATASAAESEPQPYDLTKLQKIEGASFRPTDKRYPAALAAAGVQGEVLVIVPLTDDGKSNGASLGATSRSEELDTIAVDLVKAASFRLPDAPAQGWKAIVVPVQFYKDSVTSLQTKTCADFNVDYDYQLTKFPERKPEDMRVFEMLTGILYIKSVKSTAQALDLAKRTAAARQPTIDGCRKNPESLLMSTWLASARAAF